MWASVTSTKSSRYVQSVTSAAISPQTREQQKSFKLRHFHLTFRLFLGSSLLCSFHCCCCCGKHRSVKGSVWENEKNYFKACRPWHKAASNSERKKKLYKLKLPMRSLKVFDSMALCFLEVIFILTDRSLIVHFDFEIVFSLLRA